MHYLELEPETLLEQVALRRSCKGHPSGTTPLEDSIEVGPK